MRLAWPLFLGWTGLLLAAPLAVGESLPGVEAVRQAKIKEAALRSVRESIGQLEQRQMSPDQLAATMLEDPATYQLEQTSETLLRELERHRLRDAVRDQLEVFARSRSDVPLGWVAEMMREEARQIDVTIDSLLAEGFANRYAEGRNLAIRVQSTDIDEAIRPDPADLERLAGPSTSFVDFSAGEVSQIPRAQGRQLVTRYTDQLIADRDLFEENKAKIQERVEGWLGEGLAELWRQLRFVKQHDGGGSVERSALAASIMAEVARLEGHYEVFPSVSKFAGERATQLESQLFDSYLASRLDRLKDCPGLPASTVLDGLRAGASPLPSSLDAHVQQRAEQLRPELEGRLLEPWVARAGDPALKSELRRRLLLALGSDRTDFDSALVDCVRIALEPYRRKLAVRELTRVWPEVADSTYELNDDVLTALHARTSKPGAADTSILTGRPLRLEEARELFEKKRLALIREGWATIRSQVALAVEAERKQLFQDSIRKDQDRSESRRQFWQDRYEQATLGAWRVRREQLRTDDVVLLPNKYDRILDLTKQTIADTITLAFQEPKRVARPKSGGGPKEEGEGEGTGEGPGGGEGKDEGDGDGDLQGGPGGGGGGDCPELEAEARDLRSRNVELESETSALRSQNSAPESRGRGSWLVHLLTFCLGAGLATWYRARRS